MAVHNLTSDSFDLVLLRQRFTQSTGLRTYSIPKWNRGELELFQADAPWAERHDDKTRMTVVIRPSD